MPERDPYHGCFTGDCPHESYRECMESIAEYVVNLETSTEMLDSPETNNWIEGVELEAAHQIKRWGVAHDQGKTPFDWFWLIGYLAQKAAHASVAGDIDKAKHHTISTAAALLNWHRQLSGESDRMRPGIEAPDEA